MKGSFSRNASDLKFIVAAVILAVAVILVSIALGVGINPDVSIFAAP